MDDSSRAVKTEQELEQSEPNDSVTTPNVIEQKVKTLHLSDSVISEDQDSVIVNTSLNDNLSIEQKEASEQNSDTFDELDDILSLSDTKSQQSEGLTNDVKESNCKSVDSVEKVNIASVEKIVNNDWKEQKQKNSSVSLNTNSIDFEDELDQLLDLDSTSSPGNVKKSNEKITDIKSQAGMIQTVCRV